jgi:hypothetical protein
VERPGLVPAHRSLNWRLAPCVVAGIIIVPGGSITCTVRHRVQVLVRNLGRDVLCFPFVATPSSGWDQQGQSGGLTSAARGFAHSSVCTIAPEGWLAPREHGAASNILRPATLDVWSGRPIIALKSASGSAGDTRTGWADPIQIFEISPMPLCHWLVMRQHSNCLSSSLAGVYGD